MNITTNPTIDQLDEPKAWIDDVERTRKHGVHLYFRP
jgi:hypothetical protein